MSLYERGFKGTLQKRRFTRCNPVFNHRGNYKGIDLDSLLDDPPLPHWVPKTTPEEKLERMNATRQFSRALKSLTYATARDIQERATPGDIQNRMNEQMMRRFELQRSGELGNTWKQRRNLSKRASY